MRNGKGKMIFQVPILRPRGLLPEMLLLGFSMRMLHFKWKSARLAELQREFTKRIFSREDIPVDIPAIL
jgi:hypothetical protein